MDSFPINTDTANPIPSIPKNSPESTFIIGILFCITVILGFRAHPEILFPIIKAIAILMVAQFSFSALHNLSMHLTPIVMPLQPLHGIKTVRGFIPCSTPIPLTEPFKIFGINNSILALRQWDKAVGLVKRLSYCVSLYTWFLHRPTSIGWCYSAVL